MMSTPNWSLRRLHSIDDTQIEQLADVLIDCVEGGASVSFIRTTGLGACGCDPWVRLDAARRALQYDILLSRSEVIQPRFALRRFSSCSIGHSVKAR
jgi:hypothetical protein